MNNSVSYHSMKQNIGVVGGGFTGLTAAYYLLKKGHKVTIFEKGNSLGGLAGGFRINGNNLEKAYHHIFKTDKDIISLSEELNEALKSIELLIVHSTNYNKTTGLAHVIFGSSTYAEKHGTMVNFQGRIQRIRPAVASEEMDRALDGMKMSRWDKFGTKFDRWQQGKKYDSKPSWKIISMLLNQLGVKVQYEMAEDVFTDISSSKLEFKDLDYDIIGELGVKIETNQKVNV